jgi:hypothetical protein
MIVRQLLSAMLSLAVALIIVGVACPQDEQKRQGRQHPWQASSSSRIAPAPPPVLTLRPPAMETRLPFQATLKTRNARYQLSHQPAQFHSGPQPQHQLKGQACVPKPPMVQPHRYQPFSPLRGPPLSSLAGHKNSPGSAPKPDQTLLTHSPKGTSTTKVPDRFLNNGSQLVSASKSSGKHGYSTKASTAAKSSSSPQKKMEPPEQSDAKPVAETSAPAAAPIEKLIKTVNDKYKRAPKLAKVKWPDNEVLNYNNYNLNIFGEKYAKNDYKKMSKKDLDQAYTTIHSQSKGGKT